MPGWGIVWTHQALRDLERLDRSVVQRVVKKIEQAAADPPRYFTRLKGHDDSKLRVGDYRILALLSFVDETVIVERVAHRARVYRDI